MAAGVVAVVVGHSDVDVDGCAGAGDAIGGGGIVVVAAVVPHAHTLFAIAFAP